MHGTGHKLTSCICLRLCLRRVFLVGSPGGNDLELGDDDDDTTMGADTAAGRQGRQGRDDPGETYGKEGGRGGVSVRVWCVGETSLGNSGRRQDIHTLEVDGATKKINLLWVHRGLHSTLYSAYIHIHTHCIHLHCMPLPVQIYRRDPIQYRVAMVVGKEGGQAA